MGSSIAQIFVVSLLNPFLPLLLIFPQQHFYLLTCLVQLNSIRVLPQFSWTVDYKQLYRLWGNTLCSWEKGIKKCFFLVGSGFMVGVTTTILALIGQIWGKEAGTGIRALL